MRQQEMMWYLCGVGVSFLPSCPDSFCIERGYIFQDSAKNECGNSLILFTRVQNKLRNPFNHVTPTNCTSYCPSLLPELGAALSQHVQGSLTSAESGSQVPPALAA